MAKNLKKSKKRGFKPTGIKKKGKKKVRGNQKIKGTTGHAVNYITRNQAIKKLQLTLIEFRKLCILKGIYPREPPKAPRGKDKTYYYKKDILYLMHDPIIRKFAERRVWKKKVIKARNKKMPSLVDHLKKHKPKYSLNHIVKERFPTFLDALRDLDDALSMIFLFSYMPASIKINPQRVTNCKKLSIEFSYYVMRSHSLRKVFVSIKGIYYQADIRGQTITWLVPFRFTQKINPKEVDYAVMLSFLEFHEILVGFVNFKLFQSLGLSYPPKYSEISFEMGNDLDSIQEDTITSDTNINQIQQQQQQENKETEKKNKTELEIIKRKQRESKARLSTLSNTLNKIQVSESSTEDSIDEEEEEKEVKQQGESDQQKDGKTEEEEDMFADDEVNKRRKELSVYENLFKNCHFWLSREVPRESLQFIIKSFGGKITWDNCGNEQDETITHQIVDRTVLPKQHNIMTREYIQPQWVYDCVNARWLIPTEQYKPGAQLPPHLSPFVDDHKVGYVPEYRQKLDQLYREIHGIPQPETTTNVLLEESESDEEERFASDLATEQKSSVTQSKKKKLQKLAQRQEEEEQKETAESLIPSKARRLLRRIKYNRQMKQDELDKLEDKRNKLKSGEAKVVDKSTIVYTTKQHNSEDDESD
eukprot:TRINITY_DN1466_c2_g3_i1.p1 TRINITY_DN1466_c2_g3~~TRINITY_DN1466_c2_g3_i1.p1  ORF type:complete len:646 (+),score=134.27 TRINITY_DN1466_c2_g3_i1:95-2032(+)